MSEVMMGVLQRQIESLTRQVERLGPENERVRKLLTEFDERHDADQAEIAKLRACLESTRDEICEGPVDDVLWHTEIPAWTTVDNITSALGDGWTYDGWLDAKSTQE